MSKTECLFQSFEGVGSIYVTTAKALTTQHLKKHCCKAFILIYGQKRGKGQKQDLEKLEFISIKTKDLQNQLGHLFLKAANFIDEQKKQTSIMIWSPDSWEMGAVFTFAYLIMKFEYNLEKIWKINERKIKSAHISPIYVDQLQKLYNKELSFQEPKKVDELQGTVLGQRILRIKKQYSELGKESHTISEIKKIETNHMINPQKTEKKSQTAQTDHGSAGEIPALLKKKSSALERKPSQKKQVKSFDV